jgi:outer membrane lipoprotein-sorting protein
MEGFLPFGLGGYLYPHGLAQSVMQWKSSVEGTDIIAGRETIIILLQATDDKGVLMKKHKYWIDSRTGLVLQSQIYLEYDWDKWVEQTTFTSIKYHVSLAAQTFAFQPAPDLKLVPDLGICPECLNPF